MLTSILSKRAGFFSELFFSIHHYLYSKKNKINFNLETTNWLFKYKKGWEDYFENIDNIDNIDNIKYTNNRLMHGNITTDLFTITEYKNIIPEFYIYNKTTTQKIYDCKNKLNLINKKYDSIFIRRGDKLVSESEYIPTVNYIELLLKKNPICNTIFLQTDDYNCYLDLVNYVTNNNLNIDIITLCNPKSLGGIVVNCSHIQQLIHVKTTRINNKEYISKNNVNFRNTKSVDQMNEEEIYEHTINMIIGIDITLQSQICVCEYSSNVARFIKLAHHNSNNVYNIIKPDEDINWDSTLCPCYDEFL